jgi:hypothetical protein
MLGSNYSLVFNRSCSQAFPADRAASIEVFRPKVSCGSVISLSLLFIVICLIILEIKNVF